VNLTTERIEQLSALICSLRPCDECLGYGIVQVGNCFCAPPDWDYCRACVDAGKCPKCAGEVEWNSAAEIYAPCKVCGYDVEKAPVGGRPTATW
jgi:hypothetical protein